MNKGSILGRLFRHGPLHYIIAVVLGAALVTVMLIRNSSQSRVAYGDAFTVAGAVVALVGLLGLVSYHGAFEIFGYAFSSLGVRRYRTLYEYSEAKKEKRSHGGWTFMPYITVGVVLLLVGLLLLKL